MQPRCIMMQVSGSARRSPQVVVDAHQAHQLEAPVDIAVCSEAHFGTVYINLAQFPGRETSRGAAARSAYA